MHGASDSKFSDEERARIIAEANFYTGKGPKPASLEPKPEPKPVRKEGRADLVYKTREVAVAADTGQEWAAYIEQRIADAIEPLDEAVGEVLAEERASMRAHVKTAVDELDRELGKAIAVSEGKAQGHANAIERQISEMQQRVDRAEKAMADARMELLNLAAEFRTILNDAAEAQRAISLALLHR
jgi:chromosome segregation ATPase